MKDTFEKIGIPNLFLIGGVILIALRLLFPVLGCIDTISCNYYGLPLILFFSAHPVYGYEINGFRTFSESTALAILFGGIYFILYKKRNKTNN